MTIINRQAFPLSRQLDADAGEMVLRKVEGMGVQVLTNCAPTKQLSRPAEDDPSKEVFTGFILQDGSTFEADLVIYAIGIKSRDELAKTSGIECHQRGGIVIRDDLQTSAKDVYAIGECASWKGNTYGLIGPGSESTVISLAHHTRAELVIFLMIVEMADILSFNLTQTDSHAPRVMNAPDLSTKLK